MVIPMGGHPQRRDQLAARPGDRFDAVVEGDRTEDPGRTADLHPQRQRLDIGEIRQLEDRHERLPHRQIGQRRIGPPRTASPEIVQPVVWVRSATHLAQPQETDLPRCFHGNGGTGAQVLVETELGVCQKRSSRPGSSGTRPGAMTRKALSNKDYSQPSSSTTGRLPLRSSKHGSLRRPARSRP